MDQENPSISSDMIFLNYITEMVNNPFSYNLLKPEKINPFDFDLEKIQKDVQDSKIHSSPSEALPEEIKVASKAFQESVRFIFTLSKSKKKESFSQISYAIELEVMASSLSKLKKEFLFKELAALKAINSFDGQELKNGRILCDSQFECDVLGCMAAKAETAFGPDNNWIDLAMSVASMPEAAAYWLASCTWDALTA